MKRRTPPSDLTGAFYKTAWEDAPRECWLAQFDDRDDLDPGERFEGIHLIKRGRIKAILDANLIACDFCEYGVITTDIWVAETASYFETKCPTCDGKGMPPAVKADLIEIAEWDSRNCPGLALQGRHRRLDAQAGTAELRIPATALPLDFYEFVDDWGFEIEAMRRFDNYDTAVLGAGSPGGALPTGAEQGDERQAA